METDWQSGKLIGERLKYTLDKEVMCDVRFLVGSNKTPIKAHKLILASASAVIFNMLEGSMVEKGDITVPDIEPSYFRLMLESIYTDKHVVTNDNVRGLMHAAEIYRIQKLKAECTSHLRSQINNEKAFMVFQTADDLNLSCLKEKSLTFILENAIECLSSDALLHMSQKALKQIIESDQLICKEETIFKYVILWAKTQCKGKNLHDSGENIRHFLGDILYEIRFPLIDQQYFTNEIKCSNILIDSEVIKVESSYSNEGIDIFHTHRRMGFPIIFMRCEEDLNASWSHEGQEDCIDFKSSFDCCLMGVYIFGSNTFSAIYEPTVSVYEGPETLNQTTTVVHCIEGKFMYEIKLSNPVKISKDTVYTVKLKMTGNKVFRGKSYKVNIRRGKWTVEIFQSSMPSPNLTNHSKGQIPGLILSRCSLPF